MIEDRAQALTRHRGSRSSSGPARVSFELPELLAPAAASPLSVHYVQTPAGPGRVLEAGRRRALVRVGDLPGRRLPPPDAERWFPLRSLRPHNIDL